MTAKVELVILHAMLLPPRLRATVWQTLRGTSLQWRNIWVLDVHNWSIVMLASLLLLEGICHLNLCLCFGKMPLAIKIRF